MLLPIKDLLSFFIFTVRIRLKSVKNIQKITQSMKMVSAAKYARAERELKQARPFGEGTQGKYLYFILIMY